jgi:hypothetical protein
MSKMKCLNIGLFSTFILLSVCAYAQNEVHSPYFVPYDHYMEEPGDLDIEFDTVVGQSHDINTFVAGAPQFEIGIRKWWTTELYFDLQHTKHEGGLFTGFRFENRFRLFLEEHKINPVLYIEYEHLNEADKILKEIVGFDSRQDLAVPNSVAREERAHEIEGRLILSSQINAWNLTGNFITEKNLHGEPWEFGYAFGVSRPLGTLTGKRCLFCRERFTAGLELYGGLGTWNQFTLRGTSQYIAPDFQWILPSNTAIHVSPGWGLTDQSVRMLFRVGVSQEVDGIGRQIAKLFGKH